ncbi:MAG: methyltransferase domain-containing protein [Pirellulaceae bacterium]
MTKWNAAHYLRFGAERTRAAADLLARVALDSPCRVADLGCGPGNSTSLLWQRWPEAQIVGIDNSPDMITAAQEAYPDRAWELCDVRHWNPSRPFDLVFSNAALQWLPGHGQLMQSLFARVAEAGALAFQIPSATYATVRQLIFDISRAPEWDQRMRGPRSVLTMESPAFYYDALVREAAALDIWETEYMHVLDSPAAIVDWIRSTGLRPFLDVLHIESERERFTSELQRRVAAAYELRVDGKVLFPFRRTFVVAYR